MPVTNRALIEAVPLPLPSGEGLGWGEEGGVVAGARHRRILSARCETTETRETCFACSPHPRPSPLGKGATRAAARTLLERPTNLRRTLSVCANHEGHSQAALGRGSRKWARPGQSLHARNFTNPVPSHFPSPQGRGWGGVRKEALSLGQDTGRTLSARCETTETRETCFAYSPHPPDRFSSLRDEVRGRLYPSPLGRGTSVAFDAA